jgi:hypothetical protein
MTDAMKQIQDTVDRLYRGVCFRKGERPDTRALQDVFMTGAHLLDCDEEPFSVMTVEEFIAEMDRQIAGGAVREFHEKEIAHRTDLFGRLAQRFSTYEARFDWTAKEPFAVGINSIQLIETGGTWKVISLAWNNQTDTLRIPAVYLPGR